MSSRKRSNRTRGVFNTANRQVALRPNALPFRSVPLIRNEWKSQIQDRRVHHPLKRFNPLKDMQGRVVKLKYSVKPKSLLTRFILPLRALVCLRRSIRRNVLFAFNKTGKGGQKRARWSPVSQFQCKR